MNEQASSATSYHDPEAQHGLDVVARQDERHLPLVEQGVDIYRRPGERQPAQADGEGDMRSGADPQLGAAVEARVPRFGKPQADERLLGEERRVRS